MNVTFHVLHALHLVSAGAWLGGVLFTTFAVSPALRAMKWPEPERVSVRAVIGRHYARLAGVNLALLILFALLDGWAAGFGVSFYAEYVLLAVLLCLVAAHGAYFGRRLAGLAEAERQAQNTEAATSLYATRRHTLQRLSARVSRMNLLVSATVVILAAMGVQ